MIDLHLKGRREQHITCCYQFHLIFWESSGQAIYPLHLSCVDDELPAKFQINRKMGQQNFTLAEKWRWSILNTNIRCLQAWRIENPYRLDWDIMAANSEENKDLIDDFLIGSSWLGQTEYEDIDYIKLIQGRDFKANKKLPTIKLTWAAYFLPYSEGVKSMMNWHPANTQGLALKH